MTLQALLIATVAATGLIAGAARADIKIGVTLPGHSSEMKTLEMLVRQVNAAGGVNGETIFWERIGDDNNPEQARGNAMRLVGDDEIVAVIGGSTTGTTMEMIPVFEEHEVPLISMADGIEVIDPVRRWVFKTPPTGRLVCKKIFTDIRDRDLNRVALLSAQDDFSQSMRRQCLEVVADTGILVASDETYDPEDCVMPPQHTTAGDAIVVAGFDQCFLTMPREYRQHGTGRPLYLPHGLTSDTLIRIRRVGSAADGVRLPIGALLIADQLHQDDPQYTAVTDYKHAYETQFNEPVSTFGGYAHDAFRLLIEAIREAGSTDREAVRAAIESTQNWAGVTGIFTMSDDDHMGLDHRAFRMVEIRNGEWVLLND